jgi:hypothetical protein
VRDAHSGVRGGARRGAVAEAVPHILTVARAPSLFAHDRSIRSATRSAAVIVL